MLVFEKFSNIFFVIGSIIFCVVTSAYLIIRHTRKKASIIPLTPLEKLNKEFHRHYMQARDNYWRFITENGTVIIAKGSSLALIHRGTRYPTVNGIPRIYHDLKSIAHVPVTIYILLSNQISTVSNDLLEKYLEKLNDIELPYSIDPTEQISALRIIDESRKIIQLAIDNHGSVDQDVLTIFSRHLANDIFVLLEAAAIAQLDLMHQIIQDWLTQYNINPHDSTLKILIICARTARQDNIQSVYFERLLGDDKGQNIIYIEELFDNEKKAISIFSTWFFDEKIGEAFFNNGERMHSDLLMNNNVRQYIERLMPH